jgi:hypothetical protein
MVKKVKGKRGCLHGASREIRGGKEKVILTQVSRKIYSLALGNS